MCPAIGRREEQKVSAVWPLPCPGCDLGQVTSLVEVLVLFICLLRIFNSNYLKSYLTWVQRLSKSLLEACELS